MTHAAIADAARAVTIQAGAVVSKVIYRDEVLDVTVFGFDAGEGLTEHQASRAAIVQVLEGRMRFTVDGAFPDLTYLPASRSPQASPHRLPYGRCAQPTRGAFAGWRFFDVDEARIPSDTRAMPAIIARLGSPGLV